MKHNPNNPMLNNKLYNLRMNNSSGINMTKNNKTLDASRYKATLNNAKENISINTINPRNTLHCRY